MCYLLQVGADNVRPLYKRTLELGIEYKELDIGYKKLNIEYKMHLMKEVKLELENKKKNVLQ